MKGLGYPLYVNGKLFQEPVTISHVPASGLGADRDPSMGGLGRLSGLGQYVQYYPNFPMGADDASSEEVSPNVRAVAAMIGTAIVGAGIYHGYKRNNSVGWAIGWGLLAGMFPIITIPIAIAQGFGKPKEMRSNSSRRRRRRKASSRRRTRRMNPRKREEIVYVFKGQIERGTGRGKPSYRWVDGYSRGGNTYPWLTKREAQQEAKREGKKAVFR